jgi:hypothetical protein
VGDGQHEEIDEVLLLLDGWPAYGCTVAQTLSAI